jgi:hypothetical protein
MSLAPIPDLLSRPVQRRVCAASGLAFLVCSAAGLLLANVFATAFYPSPFGPQTDVLAYFSANRVPVRAMSFVFALAALALLIFVAYSAELFADTPAGRRAALAGLALARWRALGGVLAAHRAAPGPCLPDDHQAIAPRRPPRHGDRPGPRTRVRSARYPSGA